MHNIMFICNVQMVEYLPKFTGVVYWNQYFCINQYLLLTLNTPGQFNNYLLFTLN